MGGERGHDLLLEIVEQGDDHSVAIQRSVAIRQSAAIRAGLRKKQLLKKEGDKK